MVGDPGVEPGLPCSQSRRVSVSLASGGEGRNRTGSATLAGRARYLTCHPHEWTAPDSNRKPPPCRGGALPVGASSPWPPRTVAAAQAGSAACLKMLNAMDMSSVKPVLGARRDGGARTPSTPGFGDRGSSIELLPLSESILRTLDSVRECGRRDSNPHGLAATRT